MKFTRLDPTVAPPGPRLTVAADFRSANQPDDFAPFCLLPAKPATAGGL